MSDASNTSGETPQGQTPDDAAHDEGETSGLLNSQRRYRLYLAGYDKRFWMLTLLALVPFAIGIVLFTLWKPSPQLLLLSLLAPLLSYFATLFNSVSDAETVTTPARIRQAKLTFWGELLLSGGLLVWLALTVTPHGIGVGSKEVPLLVRETTTIQAGELYLLQWDSVAKMRTEFGADLTAEMHDKGPDSPLIALALEDENSKDKIREFRVLLPNTEYFWVQLKEGEYHAQHVLFELAAYSFITGTNLSAFYALLDPDFTDRFESDQDALNGKAE